MDKIYTINEIKGMLYPVFYVTSVKKAVLFGSYAKGTPTMRSDVDILIDSEGKVTGIDFFGILEEIVGKLKVPVDLIEASQIITGSKVQREIENSGVVIYECE